MSRSLLAVLAALLMVSSASAQFGGGDPEMTIGPFTANLAIGEVRHVDAQGAVRFYQVHYVPEQRQQFCNAFAAWQATLPAGSPLGQWKAERVLQIIDLAVSGGPAPAMEPGKLEPAEPGMELPMVPDSSRGAGAETLLGQSG
jgi:hypothetical protein